jgi:hypothetical protein
MKGIFESIVAPFLMCLLILVTIRFLGMSRAVALGVTLGTLNIGFFAVFWFVTSRRIRRDEQREHQGLCPKCGYDLRATPRHCPECGQRFPMKSRAERRQENRRKT